MGKRMRYRDTASFGKRQEYRVIAELLRRGFDIYLTLVDDQGIDCVLRLDESRYLDIQIKARSEKARQWNFFAAMSFKSRNNLNFIFFTEKTDNFWIIPSNDVKRLGVTNISGKNKGKVSLNLPNLSEGVRFERFKST